MMSLATLAIGMALFGLFYSLVIGCDRLWGRPIDQSEIRMIYLTGLLTVAALVYLAYVMIRPERF